MKISASLVLAVVAVSASSVSAQDEPDDWCTGPTANPAMCMAPMAVVSPVCDQPNTKCEYAGGALYPASERLERATGVMSKAACEQKCKDTALCEYYSYNDSPGDRYYQVCMTCVGNDEADSHTKFVLYKLNCGGGADGDPHFQTWNGKFYDYMGACDLVLMDAPHFAPEKELAIHVRTKIEHTYSYIESAVVKIGDETFEVGSWADYFLNGVQNAELPATISGYPISYEQINEKAHHFEIQLEGDEKIVIKVHKSMVSISLKNPSAARFNDSKGMMGQYGVEGRLLARDGETVLTDPSEMAAEWQVKPEIDGPMLFHSAQGPQYPEQCQMPKMTTEESRRLGSTLARSAAENACAQVSDMQKRMNCISDVMATGDLDLADVIAF